MFKFGFNIYVTFKLIGAQADHFIQLLSEKNKESLKKFITREKPDECECFVWILDDTALEVLNWTYISSLSL